jgi:hypothetical protein
MHVEYRAEGMPPAIHLEFRPDPQLISMTRKFVEEFYGRFLADPDAASRVMLTIHELLENVAKFSSDGLSRLAVQMMDRDGRCFVQIRSRNVCAPRGLAQLRRLLDELRTCKDPMALYYRSIAESVDGVDGAEGAVGPGLGLARIRAEGEMDIDYAVRGNEVTILAQTQVTIRSPEAATIPGAIPGQPTVAHRSPTIA